MGIDDRLRRLEAQQGLAGPPSEDAWPREDQRDALLAALQAHALGRSTYSATPRELDLLDALIADDALPAGARELVVPMDPADQPSRELSLRRDWRAAAQRREQAEKRRAWHREHGHHRPTPPELL